MTKHFFAKAAAALMVAAACLLGMDAVHAQNRTISGTVKDTGGQPVIGAAVTVVGNTSIGAATDLNGAFSLSVPAGATMKVESIGFQSQTFTVGSQSTYNIVLEDDTEMLEETVVIGYGVQRKSDLTGAVASVNANDLKNQSTTDAAAALQGKISGVHIINSGAPGAGAEIRVRGYSSNSGNLQPLLIVDGLQVSSIQYLDPSMIESIEVLKDAASAAIYGAEAGNGVVLVTTKSGQDGRSNVTYTAKATLQNFTKRPMMGREDFLKFTRQTMGEDYVNNALRDYDYSHPYYAGGVIDQDWIDAYIEPTWSQQHSLTFSGGNRNGHFFTSLNYVYNNGVVRGDKDVYNRLSAQINADYQLFKWLQVGTNTSLEKWSTKSVSGRGYGSSFEAMLTMDPLTPVYWTTVDEMGAAFRNIYDRLESGDPTVRPYRLFRDENGWYANSQYNQESEGSPLAKRDAADATNGGINVNGTFFVNLTPIKGLTVTSRFGYRITQSAAHSYTAPYYIGPRGSNDNYSISATANTGYYYQWENFANYMVNFGKHSITAMAGMSYRENNSDNVEASASGPDILLGYEDNFHYLNYVNSLETTSKSFRNAPSRSASLAYFGRLIYSYDNRYSVQANFRADAFDSSKLPARSRWGYFPSVSAGWTVSNEPFFKDNLDNRTFNFVKLRASWGRNGNINVLSGYPYATTIAVGGNLYQYDVDQTGNTYGSSPNGLPNPNLKWETSEQVDLGLDTRFLNNRLTFSVDYFNKQTKDLLFSVPTPPELGVTSTTINGGNVLNEGFEFELGWRDHIGELEYSVSANLSTLHNEVLALADGASRVTNNAASSSNFQILTAFEQGYPVWYLRGFIYDGLDVEGNAVIRDLNGDGVIGQDDMTYIGQGTPTFTYGLNINLAWKGFDFALYGAGLGGNTILPVIYRQGMKNTLKYYLDATESGYYPEASKLTGPASPFWSSTANTFKGDFFRIKQLQLGYTLPASLTRKAAISNLRFYVSLDDFFTFTSYPGLDPESVSINGSSAASAGLDWGGYPTMQKFILGVNLTF